MRLVLGTHHLIAPAGADTYLLTVAEHLVGLGHDVAIHALEQGPLAERTRERGLAVAATERELPQECDAVLVQDAMSSFELAACYPGVPQGFVCHSDLFSLDFPPGLPGLVSAAVVMSDRVKRHIEAMPLEAEVVRLRQPVDTQRFSPSERARERPRRLVALGNYLHGPRLEMLERVCQELELDLERYGTGEGAVPTDEPEAVMADADVVVGKGRVVLEAMACARATYLYDFIGDDGWVTAESYPAMEADAFAGQSDGVPASPERLREELAAYRPEMGVANRDLVAMHHSAKQHVQELVELLQRAPASQPPPGAPLREMAQLARRQWLAESTVYDLRRHNEELRGRAEHEADRAADTERVLREVETALEEIRGSGRWRRMQAVMRPLDRLRGR